MKHNSKLTLYARELRNNMTIAEKKLWYGYLNKYCLRFRRQVTIGNYILDFFIPSVNIAIELDGSQHYEPEAKVYDSLRDEDLSLDGIKVIRYNNIDLTKNFDGVIADIMKNIGIKYEDLKLCK